MLTAAAAATAAHKFRRQVRLVVAPPADGGMNGGRCATRVNWRAGVDGDGRVTALQLDIALEVRHTRTPARQGLASAQQPHVLPKRLLLTCFQSGRT